MSDAQLDRMEKMMDDLIHIVGNTNGMVADLSRSVKDTNEDVALLRKRLDSLEQRINDRLERIEEQLYKVQVLERRQDKTAARLAAIETRIELQQEKQ